MRNFIAGNLKLLSVFVASALLTGFACPEKNAVQPSYYELRIYHFSKPGQQEIIERYLQKALIPAMHKQGIRKLGVFRSIDNDTSTDKKIYVLIPFSSLQQFEKTPDALLTDKDFLENAKEYEASGFDNTPYNRYETILLRAFPGMPEPAVPQLSNPKSSRVYELRSYEGPTEAYYRNKVRMFNEGGEIRLFHRLQFNAVFYAEVIAGSHMPNLMYMTAFEDRPARDVHWKTFGSDTVWKKLSASPEYQHNVSKIDDLFLVPAEYSDF